MGSYQEHALDGASAVDLVVALYDGIIRFLYAASAAAERGDAAARGAAVKRALDIIIHLQARLRMDVGGGRRRRSASSTHRSSRRSCKPRSRPRGKSSSMPSGVSGTCGMPGARWPVTLKSIQRRSRWPECYPIAGKRASKAANSAKTLPPARDGTREKNRDQGRRD
jgi:hypothetical protein